MDRGVVRSRSARFVTAGLAAVCAAVFYGAVGSQIVPTAQRHDFLNLYTGAILARAGDFRHMHDPARQLEIEREFVPDLPALVPFVRPAVYAKVLEPLAAMPLQRAFWVWVAIQIVILGLCWTWAARRFGPSGLVWSALFLPTAYGIANGQDCAMMLAMMIVAYELAEREHPGASGFAIGLTLIKFHLLLLFPLAMLLSRRWRMLAGYSAAAIFVIASSLALGGWGGLVEYAGLLQRKDIERLSPSPEMMSNIHAIVWNFGTETQGVTIALAGVAAAIALAAAWKAPLWRWFAAATAGSLLAAPHVYGYDAAVLLAPILFAIHRAESKMLRAAAMALALPCVFWLPAAGRPWAMGPGVAILVFLIAVGRESWSVLIREPVKNAGEDRRIFPPGARAAMRADPAAPAPRCARAAPAPRSSRLRSPG